MDLKKTGLFIAERRKEKGFTQVKLAEKICVSEKTISKWECGNGFPDTSLILPLCEALEISSNELLSAKLLQTEKEYREKAELNLIKLKCEQEKTIKHMLSVEWVLMYFSIFILMGSIFASAYLNIMPVWKVLLIIFGFVNFILGASFCLLIETKVGFYVCEYCGNIYVPKYRNVFFARHIGRSRYMKCPKCQKKSWHKKEVLKD